MPPRGRAKQKTKSCWKPSISEARDALLVHVKTPADIDEAKKKQVDFCYSKGLPLQPYMILIGPSLSNVRSSLVVINNHVYKCDSVASALDYCFKAYQVLDAQYPIACHHIWYILQWKLYRYFTKMDPAIPYINELL